MTIESYNVVLLFHKIKDRCVCGLVSAANAAVPTGIQVHTDLCQQQQQQLQRVQHDRQLHASVDEEVCFVAFLMPWLHVK